MWSQISKFHWPSGLALHTELLLKAVVFFTLLEACLVCGQLPRVCARNATLGYDQCCPTPPGFSRPCGGSDRGMCLPFAPITENFWPPLSNDSRDDRIGWPLAFFSYGCRCIGNFAGYMCHECKWGFYGKNCKYRRIIRRKNILSLSKEEKKRFIQILATAKSRPSDYVAQANKKLDPVGQPKFVTLSVYDMITYTYFYSARTTYLSETKPCDYNRYSLDFSHGGPGFPTFHRLLLLIMERELQKIAMDSTFAVPYWDWTDEGGTCSVCTNDLLGENTRDGYIHAHSRFSVWRNLCESVGEGECRVCDPTVYTGTIVRRPSHLAATNRLPTKAEVDKTLSFTQYEVIPYDETAVPSFRGCLEGNCPGPNMAVGMHKLVMAFFNGTLTSVPAAPNDPIFFLHLAFLDKLFELWMRKFKPHTTQIPSQGAPMGHNRDAVMVPFFPRHFHRWYFVNSRGLGYDYDNYEYGMHSRPSVSAVWVVLAITAPLVAIVCLAVTLARSRQTNGGMRRRVGCAHDTRYTAVKGRDDDEEDINGNAWGEHR